MVTEHIPDQLERFDSYQLEQELFENRQKIRRNEPDPNDYYDEMRELEYERKMEEQR